MGGFPAINFTEEQRSKLSLAVAVMNWICMAPSLILIATGTYIKLAVSGKMHLVEGYNGDTLPYLLISIGAISFLANVVGGIVCLNSGKPEKRQKYISFLLPYVIILAVLCICVLAGGIMCFAQKSQIETAFQKGILSAMRKYKDNQKMKIHIDLLQMQYACCGSNKYTDWFQIPWIHENYLNVESAEVKR